MSVTESTHTSKDLAKEILDAFQLLAQMAPELAYTTYGQLEPIVRDAEYERIEIVQVPFDDSPEDTYTAIRFRGEEYGEGDLFDVAIGEVWTASSLNAEEKVANFDDVDRPDVESFVYILDDTTPVRLPEDWKVRS